MVQEGAYGASLARLAKARSGVKMLWQHDPTRPIGVWDEVREDGRGLCVKGRLLLEVQAAREAHVLLQAGAIDGLSIGYRTLRSEAKGGRRLLHEIELWEVSLVTFPMLPEARVRAECRAGPGGGPGAGAGGELPRGQGRCWREAAGENWRHQGKSSMAKVESEARAGTAAPGMGPHMEVKAAVSGFLGEFNAFQSDIKAKLQEQESRLAMLDRKSIAMNRPPLARAAETETPHKKAFAAYLRSGDDDGLRGLTVEEKALSTAVAADGGYLVDPVTASQIVGVLRSSASIRTIANVVTVEASAFDVLVDHTDIGVGLGDRDRRRSRETGTPQVDRISIPLHELSALPKASQRLLDDSAFDVEGWLAQRIADKFSRAEASAFISGDGTDKPTGFLNYPKVDNDLFAWGSLGYVPTGADGDFDAAEPADAIVDLVYALGARYRANATFVMNSKTAGAVRKMKDADGRFLWSDGLAAGEPARLMGYPVLIAEDMPDIASGAFAIAYGDFRAGYTVAERPDLRILRDPFSAKPHVLFYATKRIGGDVSDFAAIKLLKFASA